MGIQIGMPTLLELSSLNENIELCRKLNLQFVEVNMNLPYCLPKHNDAVQVARCLKDCGVGLTIHMPEEIDVSTPYDSFRRANIELFSEIADWGSKVNCQKIVMHINQGVYFTLPDRKAYIYETDSDSFSCNAITELNKMAAIAKSHDILLCIENTVMNKVTEQIVRGIIDNQDIGFTWDVGHDVRDGNRTIQLLSKHFQRIKHMHLHDFDGKNDHLTLFSGNMNISDKFDFACEHDMSVVIEVKTVAALTESVSKLRENLEYHQTAPNTALPK